MQIRYDGFIKSGLADGMIFHELYEAMTIEDRIKILNQIYFELKKLSITTGFETRF